MTWFATLLVLAAIAAGQIGLLRTLRQLHDQVRHLRQEVAALHGMLDYRLGRQPAGDD